MDGTKPSRQDYKNLYKTKQWRSLRKYQLMKQPWCQCPHHHGLKIPANIVDHIKPHKGNRSLFFDSTNLQSLTKQCHDKQKQSEERGGRGFDMGCNENGEPLNKDSEWYQ